MPIVSIMIGLVALGPPAAVAPDDGEGESIRALYVVDLVGRGRATFALPEGRRTIGRFAWVPDPEAPGSWRSARLRLVWDGDDPDGAGVDVPLGRFVATRTAAGGGAPATYVNRRPMPYRRGGRLIIDAEAPVRGTFRLDLGPGGPDLDGRGYLRAARGTEGGTDAEGPSGPVGARSGGSGGASPPVRFWYDEGPGP